MSKSEPRARLIRTPRPWFAPAHSPTRAPDDRERHANAHAAEDVRQRGRDLEREQDLATGRPQAPAELEQARIHRADPDHRRDGDREEHDQGADHHLAEKPVAKPQDQQRRKREDRDRLGGDQVGRQQPFDQDAPRQPVPSDQGEQHADRKAEPDLDQRGTEVRLDRAVAPGLHEADGDRLGGREDERRQAADHDDGLPDQHEDANARSTDNAAARVMTRARWPSAWSPPGSPAVSPSSSSRNARMRCEARPAAGSSRAAIDLGRGRSIAMSATIRAGRADRTTTRSAISTASGMLWVTMTMVVAARCQRRSSSRSNRSRVRASSALNGSSSSRTSGSRASARASATRCRVPPDSSAGREVVTAGSRSTNSLRRASRSRRRRAGQPASSSG